LSTNGTPHSVPPDISVVICVYTEDRWEDILAAVASVRAQTLPALETLLVVDHNPALLDRLAKEYKEAGEVRVLPNAGPRGLSAGRNTGIAASHGGIIAFLDDDAVAERDWLRRFADSYGDPRVMAVGGRTVPVWASGRRPDWFPEEFDWVVGCSYRGLPPGRVRVRNILGGNASFRREAFDIAGGFATGIGRDGDKRPLGGEETELCIRLSRARPDAVLLVDDRAVIHHKVPEAREHFAYFRTRTYAEGLSKALVARSVGAAKGLESERRYTTRVLPAGVARGLRDQLMGRTGGARRAGAIVAGVLTAAGGYAVGSVRARRNGTTFSVVRTGEVTGRVTGAAAYGGAETTGGPAFAGAGAGRTASDRGHGGATPAAARTDAGPSGADVPTGAAEPLAPGAAPGDVGAARDVPEAEGAA
jgi:GT2 family glycosyltransferase